MVGPQRTSRKPRSFTRRNSAYRLHILPLLHPLSKLFRGAPATKGLLFLLNLSQSEVVCREAQREVVCHPERSTEKLFVILSEAQRSRRTPIVSFRLPTSDFR